MKRDSKESQEKITQEIFRHAWFYKEEKSMLRFKIPQISLERRLVDLDRNNVLIALFEMGLNRRPEFNLMEFLYHRTVAWHRMPDTSMVNKKGLYPGLMALVPSLKNLRKDDMLKLIDGVSVGVAIVFVGGKDTLHPYYALPESSGMKGPVLISAPGATMEKIRAFSLREAIQEGGLTANPGAKSTGDGNNAGTTRGEWKGGFDRLAGGISEGNVDEGFRLLEKARRLRVFVLGAGRAGSWLAFRLAQEGVGAEGGLIIIDPDVLERSNLDGTFVPHGASGISKSYAVASTIKAMVPNSRPMPIYAGLNNKRVVDVLRTCDIGFVAVDENSARFAFAALGTRYHLVYIDVCGGSERTEKGEVATGGELRIFIPGTLGGCLACFGRYNEKEIEHLLDLTDDEERERRKNMDWSEKKAGSNVDVLMPLIGEALQSFWGILRGEIRESRWLHYEKAPGCMPVWQDWSDRRWIKDCPFCSRQSGLGDIA